MYRFIKFTIYLVVLTSLVKLIYAQENAIPILPQPQYYKYTSEKFIITNRNIELKSFCEFDNPILYAINDLNKAASKYHRAQFSQDAKYSQSIFIGLYDKNKEFDAIISKYDLKQNENIGDEGYNLLIDSNEIVLAANNTKGIFYGLQSLIQLIRANHNKNYIPGLHIIDYPSFKYRSIMDDISRGPIPTLDYMKYQIRRLAEMKVNTIIHYVEHVVKTESHPEFAPDDGSLTIDEWKVISDYALNYNITVIGGFQSFGHFQKILETPEYAHLGESGSLISPLKEESYEFLENIYNEMIPAFHSDIFNINCDETFDLGKEDSKKLVDSLGYGEVYFRHIMKLYEIVKSHNKRMIMWGDILMQYPELISKLPQDVLIGTWNYDAKETFKEFIDPFKDSGHELWIVPGVLNSRRIYPDFDKALKNIRIFVEEGYKAGATGVLNCFWDDGSTGLFSNDWYGAAYGADKSWNVNASDKSFDYRYAKSTLVTNNNYFFNAIRKINELRFFELTDGMTDKFLFVKLIPETGKSLKVSLADLDTCNIIVNEAKDILNKAEFQRYSDDIKYLEFIIELYEILIRERFQLLEAANTYRDIEIATDLTVARKKLLNVISIMNELITNQKYLKTSFETLWLRENHTYALDWITSKYDLKINDFINVKKLLLESLKKFDSSKPILPINEVRLDISELPGKYFTEWMMINPLPNEDNLKNSEIDYLIDMGGESTANPKVTQEFYYNKKKYRWRRVVSDQQDMVNLNDLFKEESENRVMYAFANITVPENKEVDALLGFSNGIEVFVNGASVFSASSDKLSADLKKASLPLKKGKNNLLIKVTKHRGDWGFSIRLPNSKVRNSKNRYKIVNKEY